MLLGGVVDHAVVCSEPAVAKIIRAVKTLGIFLVFGQIGAGKRLVCCSLEFSFSFDLLPLDAIGIWFGEVDARCRCHTFP